MNGIGGIGGWELLLVAVIAMLVLGPEHMVKHAYRFGRWARKFSGYWQEAVGAFREQLKDIEKEAVAPPKVGSVSMDIYGIFFSDKIDSFPAVLANCIKENAASIILAPPDFEIIIRGIFLKNSSYSL